MSLRGALLRSVRNDSPVPLVSTRGSNWLNAQRGGADMNALMDTMSEVGTIFAIVDKLATGVAMPEWKMYVRAASGIKEDRTEVTSHGVLDLLNNPNPFMSLNELMEAGQQHAELVGETDIVVGRARGVKYPIELWPAMPQRLSPVPDAYKYLAAWMYKGPDGDTVPLELDEIIRFRRPNPQDPYRGISWVQPILVDLDADRYGQEWQRQFYLNSAQPGGVIEVDRRLSDDEFAEMTYRWREQHQGINKAHRVAVIENGSKYVSTPLTQKDMQFAEMSTVMRDKALAAAGFPKSMLGITEDVNRANAEAGEYMYSKWLLTPRLERWRGMLNRQLLPLFGQDIARKYELDYESPVPENSEQAIAELTAKTTAIVALAGAGFDAKKVEEFLDLPDLGHEKPEPPTIVAPPPVAPGEPKAKPDPAADPKAKPDEPQARIEAAQKWETEVHEDDSTCDPCLAQKGKTYRNREDAYKDYPGGAGYKDCVGAEFGNQCRCTVKKRGK